MIEVVISQKYMVTIYKMFSVIHMVTKKKIPIENTQKKGK